MPAPLGLAASLVISTGLFLGLHRLRKYLLSFKPPFSLKRTLCETREAQKSLALHLSRLTSKPGVHRELESVQSSLEVLISTLGSRPEEDPLLASQISEFQSTALRLGQMAQDIDENALLSRIEELARHLASRCQNKVLRQKDLLLLEWESELEALELTVGSKKGAQKS